MPLTPTQLVAEIDAQLPTSGIGLISAAALRGVLTDIVNNQTGTGGGSVSFSGTGDPGLTRAQAHCNHIRIASEYPSNDRILHGGRQRRRPVH
jgi:hypothetical protein